MPKPGKKVMPKSEKKVMPISETKNSFINGKYGLDATYDQTHRSFQILEMMVKPFDAKLSDKLGKYDEEIVSHIKVSKYGTMPNGFSFMGSTDESQVPIIEERTKEIRGILQQKLKFLPKGMDSYYGYFTLIDKLLDTKAGDYGRAMVENTILANLMSQFQNGPNINDLEENIKYLSSVNPVTGKPQEGPLKYLNEYFNLTSQLLQLEYDKQKINDNYSPELEQIYLKQLNDNYKKMLENHEHISGFVREDGNSDYDKYLQNRLDTMVRKDIEDGKSHRTAQAQIENIRGQQKAIENGWGMYELDFPGKLSELAWYIEIDIRLIRNRLKPELIEKSKQINERRVSNRRKIVQEYEEKIAIAEKELKALKKKKTSKEVLDAKQKEYDDLAKEALRRKNDLRVAERDAKNAEQNIINDRKVLENTVKFYSELKAFNEEVQNTKVTCATDKIRLSDKFDRIMKNPGLLSSDVANQVKQCIYFSENAMKGAGRGSQPVKIPKEIADTSMTEKDFELYGPYFAERSLFSGWLCTKQIIDSVYPNLALPLNEELDAFIEENSEEEQLNNEIYSGKRSRFAPTMTKEINKTVSDACAEYSEKLSCLSQKAIYNMTGDRSEFKRSYRANIILVDESRGSIMKAMSDRDYLLNFYTQVSGNAPEAFSEKVSAGDSTKWLKERGALDIYNDFSEAGMEFFQIELEKQQMQKTGWNDEKERLYLAKLDEAIGKNIAAYEKLLELPLDVQEQGGYMGNNIGHVTGKDSAAVYRDITRNIHGIKYMKEGIKLGYKDKDLYVMNELGKIKGNIEVTKIRLDSIISREQQAIDSARERLTNEKNTLSEKEIKKLNNLIATNQENIRRRKILYSKVNEFEEKRFKPLSDSILSRKIESPTDVIKTIVQLQEFYDNNRDIEELTDKYEGRAYLDGYDLFTDAIAPARDKLFADTINEKLKEFDNIRATGKKPGVINTEFKICDKSRELSSFVDALKADDSTDKDYMKVVAGSYLYNLFLNGMNEDAHPEFFNPKHPDYNISRKKLTEYSEQYAERLLTILQPESSREFAGMLELGNHNNFLSDAKDKISAEASKSRYEAFISGKPPRYSDSKTITEAIKGMDSASSMLISDSEYDSIMENLKKLDKMKKSISKQLKKQEATEFKIKVSGYEMKKGVPDKTHPQYDITLAEDIKADPKKLEEYIKLQEETYEMMGHYFKEKDALIKEMGGDPSKKSGIILLGKTEARQYMAAFNARNSLIAMNKATTEFAQHGYTKTEREAMKLPGLGLDRSEYIKSDKKVTPEEEMKAREEYIAGEKERYIENIKYGIINKSKEIEKSLSEDTIKQDASREKMRNEFIKLKNPTKADIKKYEDNLYNSAIQTMYSEILKQNYENKKSELFLGSLRNDVMQNHILYNQSKDLYDGFNKAYQEQLESLEGKKISAKDKKELDRKLVEIKEFKKITEESKKAYEDSVKRNDKISKDIANGTYPAEIVGAISSKDLLTVNEGLRNAHSDYIKKNPKGINDFKSQIIQNEPFKDEFRKQIIDASKNKSLGQKDIFEIRDNIIKNYAVKHKKNPEKLENLDKLSHFMGSNVESANAIKEANKMMQAEKQMHKAPNKVSHSMSK